MCKQASCGFPPVCGASFLTTKFDIGGFSFRKGFVGCVVQYLTICLLLKCSVLNFCFFSASNATYRWATRTADRGLLDCFKAVKAVGGVELSEEGGGEGRLDDQHVPRHDLLLGNHVTTLRF